MMNLRDLVTIVVPCKNEELYIGHLLYSLRRQQGIGGVRIIIADKSDDNTLEVIQKCKGLLNVEICEGGPVSEAKNNGASLVTTDYLLFIDSDVRFFSETVIIDTVKMLEEKQLDLIGLNIRCYDGNVLTQAGFVVFNLINSILSKFSPFAVGAYMLTRTSKFRELGGFPNKYVTSEDFHLSRMYSADKFAIANHYFGQDSRRFKKMGYFGMTWYLVKNFINRNNEQYWRKLNGDKYWL